ncbi:hypothetical protein KTR66_00835 [Roseococcus sp. SDR]|uniref:hypothetical protein n=1 Tax=Roseococcus sp. SDR TaxID=2835532 RepID=UPI001BD0646B|nr:hypothetical protein [Roseococcus sp. SDR]MBS7788515.1 hypothetical protein [Roseococcus sp. SDR]MBV1843829.1 hypothetical protein [Roseococcus sp. SDR]
MLPDSMTEAAAPLAALMLALAWAGLLRWRRRPMTAGLGLGLAAAFAVLLLLGVMLASPRQLAERLPVLSLVALGLTLPLAWGRRGWLAALLGLSGAVFTGWWMAGGPLTEADLLRAAPAGLALMLLVPLVQIEAAPPWRGVLAAVALVAGLLASGVPGPWVMLGLILLSAAFGQQVAGGGAMADTARLPFAMLLAALVAGPLLARGAAADWAAAIAPLAPLLLGPRLSGRLKGWRASLIIVLLAAVPVAAAWGLARLG